MYVDIPSIRRRHTYDIFDFRRTLTVYPPLTDRLLPQLVMTSIDREVNTRLASTTTKK